MNKQVAARGTLVDSIYLTLKQSIIASQWSPGEKLNARIIAEKLHVSETPVKQALNRLISEGLVENIPHKGMRIHDISWKEVDEALEIRLMIDLYFIRPIIQNLSGHPETIEQLKENLRQQQLCARDLNTPSTYQDAYRLDQQFHELYLSCCGNQKAVSVFQTLNSHVYSSFIYRLQPCGQILTGIQEHQLILDAMLGQDVHVASHLVTVHITNARQNIRSALQKKQQEHKADIQGNAN